jgi:RNA polymerase sigma-70 factor (ECF subfamily)
MVTIFDYLYPRYVCTKMLEYKNNSDLELLLLLKKGEQVAFAELFQRYHHPLYLHARRMLGDMDEAKDIVQDVFASIWSKRDNLTIPAAVDAYLYGAVKNRILNVIAHQHVVSRYAESIDRFLENGIAYTDEQVREKELARIIEKEISLLPEKMRVVFEMSRNDELSYREIAERLNISENTVKKQAQRALKILKLRIKLNLFLSALPF